MEIVRQADYYGLPEAPHNPLPRFSAVAEQLAPPVPWSGPMKVGGHKTKVAPTPSPNHGYPYRAECECGWHSPGYAHSHAAESMADSHRSDPTGEKDLAAVRATVFKPSEH